MGFCSIVVVLAKFASDVQALHAGVVELADTLDLGSNGATCAGSSPVTRSRAGEKWKTGLEPFQAPGTRSRA